MEERTTGDIGSLGAVQQLLDVVGVEPLGHKSRAARRYTNGRE
jgi:hypothetical protein